MKQEEAENLLNETFSKEFNSDKFVQFLKELFKGKLIINPKSSSPHEEFKEYIKSFKKIGEYKNGRNNIEILIVELKKTSSLERARTMQRNFIAKWLNSDYSPKDGAVVAFYENDLEDWRFSFVKMDYKFGEDGKVIKEITPAKRYSFLVGKNEPNHTCKKQFLNLLKEETVSPTLVELEKAFSVDNVTKEFFDQYKDRFIQLKESIEEIIEKNSIVRKEFEDKGIDIIEFSKKLLGQIVFLYFLQKKGWLGVKKDNEGKFNEWGTGPKDFMRKLFNKDIVNYENFFNDILEPLFYQALANDRTVDNNYYEKLKCKVPFLNGGLFEPIKDYDWTKTDILIDNNVFKDIFNTFDQFNFTIKEDEPLEKEVAVDPEMLGKVFENLLDIKDRKSKGAFYTPREIVHYMCQQSLINYLETNTFNLEIKKEEIEIFILKGDIALDKLRRIQLGKLDDFQLVLPKSIVNNYQALDILLKEIKICDPAVGSGAFPVGMMSEIVKARNILTYFFTEKDKKERTDYFLKRQTIENSLYGVDIEPSAVEITKLRFWLSLIVDELDMKNIKPLPNLDHKIMCGNSLLEEFEGVKLFDEKLLGEVKKDNSFELKQINDEIARLYKDKGNIITGKSNGNVKGIEKEIKKLENKKQKLLSAHKDIARNLTLEEATQHRIKESQKKLTELKRLQNQFFNAENRNIKKQLRDKIDKIEWELIEETLKEQGNKNSIIKLKQYRKNRSKPFFLWKLYFSEIFQRENPGFDIVIANPPYVGEKGHKELFREIKISEFGKRFYKRKMDLFYFFFHKSIDLSRKNATVSFITTNYFITADGAVYLRTDFKNRIFVYKMINFNELRIFDTAKGQHNLITILRNQILPESIVKTCVTHRVGDATSEILKDILNWNDRETDYFSLLQKELYDGEKNYIRLNANSTGNSSPVQGVLSKVKKDSTTLGKIKNVNQGLLTGADKVTDGQIEKLNLNGLEKGEGIYVLSNDEINRLNLNSAEKRIIKPFYKNSDINKYFTNSIEDKKNLIYLTRDLEIDDFPHIKNHVLKYQKIIKNRSQERGEMQAALKLGKWWVIFASRNNVNFDGKKIVCPQRSLSNTFGYNEEPWYSSADVYYITDKEEGKKCSLKYILSLLNSKLYYVWLYNRGKRKGELLELLYQPLSEIPIKEISPEQQKPFVQLVDQILSITKDEDYLNNSDKQAKVKKLEKEIDKLVYNLYELMPEEIKIVEEFNKE